MTEQTPEDNAELKVEDTAPVEQTKPDYNLKQSVRFDAVIRVAWQERTDPAAAKHISEYISQKPHEPLDEDYLRAFAGDELTNILVKVAALHDEYFAIARRISESIAANTPKDEVNEPEHENDRFL